MENLKLISFRIEPEILKKIDELATKSNYRSRSSIIQNILKHVIECSDSGTLWRIIDTFFAYDKGYKVDFKIDAEECQRRNSVRE